MRTARHSIRALTIYCWAGLVARACPKVWGVLPAAAHGGRAQPAMMAAGTRCLGDTSILLRFQLGFAMNASKSPAAVRQRAVVRPLNVRLAQVSVKHSPQASPNTAQQWLPAAAFVRLDCSTAPAAAATAAHAQLQESTVINSSSPNMVHTIRPSNLSATHRLHCPPLTTLPFPAPAPHSGGPP